MKRVVFFADAGRRNEAKAGPFLPAACGSTHQGESRVTVHSRESNGWRAMPCNVMHSHNFVEPHPLAIKAIHSKRPRGVSKNPPTVNISCVQGVV